MSLVVKITKIPQLNSVVIKQEGGHFFISTPNSLIIDKDGLLSLIAELGKVGFLTGVDLVKVMNIAFPLPKTKKGYEDEEETA